MISELIDLTEHRDFGNRIMGGQSQQSITLDLQSIFDDINKKRNKGVPWETDVGDYIPYDGIFPLGNKIQRQKIKDSVNWGTPNATTCDCCGVPIKSIPWKSFLGLCNKCANDFKKENIGGKNGI